MLIPKQNILITWKTVKTKQNKTKQHPRPKDLEPLGGGAWAKVHFQSSQGDSNL